MTEELAMVRSVWRDLWAIMGGVALFLNLLPWSVRSRLDDSLRRLWDLLFSAASDRSATVRITSTSAPALTPLTSLDFSDTTSPFESIHFGRNSLYDDVSLYLSTLDLELRLRDVHAYGLRSAGGAAASFVFGIPLNHTLSDPFRGCNMHWTLTNMSGGGRGGGGGGDADRAAAAPADQAENAHMFVLKLPEAEKRRLLRPYLEHIAETAKRRREQSSQRTLYTNRGPGGCTWTSYAFKHPSTFESLALAEGLEERIRQDLAAFAAAKEFYHASGRVWKRGYLLYGPPGTGKSSLIAAIANFLHYDVYDLELTNVYTNSQLRELLMNTTRKSVIVIEDIDCAASSKLLLDPDSVDAAAGHEEIGGVSGRGALRSPAFLPVAPAADHGRMTLSGLLNFADGLMSCFGEERIFVFTTNHKERLSSALLRHGRMDMHILLTYCTFPAFKKLALNYLGVAEHRLFPEIRAAFELPEAAVTPASVSEILISGREDPDASLQQLLDAVRQSAAENSAGVDNTAAPLAS